MYSEQQNHVNDVKLDSTVTLLDRILGLLIPEDIIIVYTRPLFYNLRSLEYCALATPLQKSPGSAPGSLPGRSLTTDGFLAEQ